MKNFILGSVLLFLFLNNTLANASRMEEQVKKVATREVTRSKMNQVIKVKTNVQVSLGTK